jgi:hypothetical protein
MVMPQSTKSKPVIGTLSEKSLHASIKRWYSKPGDEIEVRVDGFVIDIVRGKLLIEVQTKNFSAMRRKLTKLVEKHKVHLIHPVPVNRWIVKRNKSGKEVSRRKSPAHGEFLNIFDELIRIPDLVGHKNLSVEVLLIHEEVIWLNDGKGSWRRKKWSIHDRELLEVVGQKRLSTKRDYKKLIPKSLEAPFSNKELAAALKCRLFVAQRMTYTLRKAGILDVVGKKGNAFLHELS